MCVCVCVSENKREREREREGEREGTFSSITYITISCLRFVGVTREEDKLGPILLQTLDIGLEGL